MTLEELKYECVGEWGELYDAEIIVELCHRLMSERIKELESLLRIERKKYNGGDDDEITIEVSPRC